MPDSSTHPDADAVIAELRSELTQRPVADVAAATGLSRNAVYENVRHGAVRPNLDSTAALARVVGKKLALVAADAKAGEEPTA